VSNTRKIRGAPCSDCGQQTTPRRKPGEWYVVRGDVWAAAGMPPMPPLPPVTASDREAYDAYMRQRWRFLCIGCLETRLGRRLGPDDFTEAPVNRAPHHSERMRSRVFGFEEPPAS
jgi:hypothetical protein